MKIKSRVYFLLMRIENFLAFIQNLIKGTLHWDYLLEKRIISVMFGSMATAFFMYVLSVSLLGMHTTEALIPNEDNLRLLAETLERIEKLEARRALLNGR